jgi:hypothetical protein
VETYANAADLAESLYERGSLLGLFGDRAQAAHDELTRALGVGAAEFSWSFLLVVSVPPRPAAARSGSLGERE